MGRPPHQDQDADGGFQEDPVSSAHQPTAAADHTAGVGDEGPAEVGQAAAPACAPVHADAVPEPVGATAQRTRVSWADVTDGGDEPGRASCNVRAPPEGVEPLAAQAPPLGVERDTLDPGCGSRVCSAAPADEPADRKNINQVETRIAVKAKPISSEGHTPWCPARPQDLGEDFPKPSDGNIRI